MRTELVNTLLKAGVVTEAQVDRALNYSFGSSVVERLLCLGYGSEDDVFKIIMNKLKLAVIDGHELDNISRDVLSAIPKELMQKHHFLPFYSDNAKIHIAFFDPTSDYCLNEVCFFVPKKIVPFGVKASILARALNRYFGLNIPETFKFGKEQVSNPGLMPPPLVDKGKTAMPQVPKMPLPKMPPLPNVFKNETVAKAEKTQEQMLQQVELASDEPEPEIFIAKETSFHDVDDTFNEFKDINTVDNLDDTAVSSVRSLNSKEEIINSIGLELNKLATRYLILFVKHDDLVSVEDPKLRISLKSSSFFKQVFDTKKTFYGATPRDDVGDNFFKDYGGDYVPSIICLTPVSIENEVFAMLYAEEVSDPMQVEALANLMSKDFDRLLSN